MSRTSICGSSKHTFSTSSQGYEYKSPAFGKGGKKSRVWLENAHLFKKDASGVEMLSVEGKSTSRWLSFLICAASN